MDKKEILFIPGWMDKGEFHGYPNSLNIWTEKINLDFKFKENIIIGHSVGASLALLNWEKNKNSKLILFGPLIPRRNLLTWFHKWIRFILYEGTPMPIRRIKLLRHLILGTVVLVKMLKVDSLKIIRKIPKDKLIIVKGTDDKYFCDEKIANQLKKEGFDIIEVKRMGHNWGEKIEEFLDNYLYEN